jgi:hypothetical protein
MAVFIISLSLASISLGVFDFKNGISFDNTTVMLMVLSVLIMYCIIKQIFSKKKYKKLFDSNKTIEEKCNYYIDENVIIISSESGTSTLTKETIYKIVINKDSIYIFLAMNMAKMIKKSFLKNNEEYDALISFLKENYREKMKKK